MADTTHNLKIKATLDASGIQSELDRLNQMDRSKQGGQNSAASTTRILTKLDQTLNRLNRTLENMPRGFQNPTSRGAVPPGSYQGPPVALSPDAFRRAGQALPYNEIRRQISSMNPGWCEADYASRKIGRNLGRMSTPLPWNLGVTNGAKEIYKTIAQAMGGYTKMFFRAPSTILPTIQSNLHASYADAALTDAYMSDRVERAAMAEEIRAAKAVRDGRGRGMADNSAARGMRLFFTSMMARQAAQIFPENELGMPSGVSTGFNVVGGALAGASTGLMFGPVGMGIGLAAGAIIDLAAAANKAKEALDEYRKRQDVQWKEGYSAENRLRQHSAQYLPLREAMALRERAVDNLVRDREKMPDALQSVIDLSQKPATQENMKLLEKARNYMKVLEDNIKAGEALVKTVEARMDAEHEYTRQQNANIRAYRREQRRHDDFYYGQMRGHYDASTSNVQDYRQAQRQYREQMRQRDLDLQHDEMSMSVQRILGQIRTNSFTGDLSKDSVYSGLWRGVELDSPLGPKGGPTRQNARTASWWYELARDRRIELELMHGRIQNESNPEELKKLYDQRGLIQSQFNSFMQIAAALRQIGQPVSRVDLKGMTSLASRGGWMGEQYRQPEYMQTLDKMYETLRSIDDNTREAEKNVWR